MAFYRSFSSLRVTTAEMGRGEGHYTPQVDFCAPVFYIVPMEFEWGDDKCKSNLVKHNLSFEDAHLVFDGDTMTIPDLRRHYGENRLITMGSLRGRIVVVVHVLRSDKTRIISMRRANVREQRIYQKRFGQA